ncbi:unnamed protein product [Rotaria socialis]|uniref:Uncharacterized protein n=1 Tax=Rotaria socialis TaxID=392032 RepID=A0A820YU02_9BILA|nr:unnamed protein product [Rotaria socialis]
MYDYKLDCDGRPCAKCKKCRDWHFNGDDETWRWVCNWQNWTQNDKQRWDNGGYKCFTKRNDGATCVDYLSSDLVVYYYLGHVCLCDRH